MSGVALQRLGHAIRASGVTRPAGSGWRTLRYARPLSQHPGQTWRRAYSTETTQDTTNKSFVMNMFLGKMETAELFPYPEVLSEEQKQNLTMFIDPVTKFFEEVNDAALNDRQEGIPDEVFSQMKEMGAFGLQVPTNLGGVGLTNTQYARMVEIVGGYDLAVGIALGAHQSIGFKGIVLYGTDEQKKKYLPKLAAGDVVAAYCLTEPSSGSDASSIRTRAVKSEDGQHYILNGGKIWISNGGIAEIFTVFAQTPVTDPKTGETKDKISAFVVERGFGGVTSGPPEKKMGIKASNTAEVHFEDVKVPVANLLGEEGKGFYVAMNILNNGRFGMAAALSGTMKTLIRRTADHVSTRVQFGSKLEAYGVVQEKLAYMALRQYVTESMAYLLSGNMDKGSVEYQLEAAISKIYSSESAWWVADETIQLHGGMGFMSECGLERVMRDLRIFRIFEGSNDILRLFVSLTGLQYAGKQLRELEKSLKGMDFGVIMSEGLKRTRRLMGSSSAPSVSDHAHNDLSVQSDQLSQLVGDFGTTCEKLLLTHRKNIIHEQFLLQRLANAAIDIYGMAAVISRASKSLTEDVPTSGYERLMAATFCQQAFDRTSHTLQSITSSKDIKLDGAMSNIAKEVVENGETVPVHPLGF